MNASFLQKSYEFPRATSKVESWKCGYSEQRKIKELESLHCLFFLTPGFTF